MRFCEYVPLNHKMIGFAVQFVLLSAATHCMTLPPTMIKDLSRQTNMSMEKYGRTEEAILSSRSHLPQGTPAWYLSASHEMTEGVQNLSRTALRVETMAVMLVEALKMTPKDAVAVLPSVGTTLCTGDTANFLRIMAQCQKSQSRFRTHSGKCNNALYPTRGASLEAYARFLAPEYQDGVSLPRANLPSAREVSLSVHSAGSDARHPYLLALAALFGQFLAHDLAHTPRMELPDGRKLKCCDVEFENFHPECFPIKAENDVGCMEYTRSAPHPGNSLQGCKLGPRQQINQATSFLDLSPVYGSSEEASTVLRSFTNGLLNTQRKNLPMASRNPATCRSSDKETLPCFLSGDPRVNEHPGLAMMHVVFLREHNRVADQLKYLNPTWDDERLYQEARRVVIAEAQHITYNEYLPIVFGEKLLDQYDLRLTRDGFFRGYDFRVDPTISNAAASAGLFFAASLTPRTLDLVDSRTSEKLGERSLFSAFYAPQELYEAGAIDRLITEATVGHSRKPSPPGLDEFLQERYFHDGKTKDVAVDYVAQMIQQGRDHGLPPYSKWRTFCGLPEAQDFQALQDTMSQDAIRRLQSVYRTVQEVDLVTGALSEAAAPDSILGPTFACLLGRTFRNLRLGDRYWYENANSPGSFTLEQLEEIRKSTMSKILCDNGDALKRMQPRAFILRDPFLNNVANCSSYLGSGMDLTPWKERKHA